MKITPAQLSRLQTVCSQMATRVAGYANTRENRLQWASGVLRHAVTSFSALSMQEARKLIDAAQGEIGHRAPLKPSSKRKTRTAENALRAGVDGRRNETRFADTPQIVSSEDLEVIADYYTRLGWSKASFDLWLTSGHSPIGRKKTITTTAQANRVRWALKRMLKIAGLWVEWSAA